MRAQARRIFVPLIASIWLDVDSIQDNQFCSVELSMVAQMRRFGVDLTHRHQGAVLRCGFEGVPTRCMELWHSLALLRLGASDARAVVHVLRIVVYAACRCSLARGLDHGC